MPNFNGTAAELREILTLLPKILSGEIPVPASALANIHLRVAVSLLSCIQQDFVVKSRGGVGRDGIKWKPLDPRTIAARPVTASERKAAGEKGKGQRGLLSPAENKRWKAIYASTLARARAKGTGDAEGLAARTAWSVLKSQGAKTKLAVYGSRQVDIGRDTSRMYRSLTPGVVTGDTRAFQGDAPDSGDQVFVLIPGGAIVGSNVPYFERFHNVRPVWPLDNSIPEAWMVEVMRQAVEGIIIALQMLIQSGWRP